jgi:DNA-directed RNA polymerase specialized sigma24 family protein
MGTESVIVHHSPTEALEAIRSLSDRDKTVLVKVAKAYARTRKTRYDHQDLFHEAVARILEGKRGWPQGVGILPFLCGVMRGIAWDWRTQIYDEAPEASSASEEGNAIARLDAQKFVALFADDIIAQQIVVGIMEGARGEELWEQSGLSKIEYESKRRKIRRRIEKLWLENKDHGVD